jgi:hypothetical protein
MSACDYCGSADGLGFTCKLCSRTHCQSNRLPENHDCPNLDEALPPGKATVTSGTKTGWNEKPYLRERSVDGPIPSGPEPLPAADVPTYGTPPEEDLDSGPDMAPDGTLVGEMDTSSLDPEPGRGTSGTSNLIPSRVIQYAEAPTLLVFDLLKLAVVVGIAVGVWYLL